ncbi:MAG: hypothetical protein IJ085_08335 [Turicibacter sp.]|nr:hypothetical protein [Turicibacter sp.]
MELLAYIESLFETVVGGMKIPPLYFYQMTIRECALAIKGHQTELENNYQLSFLASYNANGLFNAKKFKVIEPFGAKTKPKKTIKDREETLEFLKSKF